MASPLAPSNPSRDIDRSRLPLAPARRISLAAVMLLAAGTPLGAQTAKLKADAAPILEGLRRQYAGYTSMASDLKKLAEKTCPSQDNPEACRKDFRETSQLAQGIADGNKAAELALIALTTKGSAPAKPIRDWQNDKRHELLDEKFRMLKEKYKTPAAEETAVTFENDCVQLIVDGPLVLRVYAPELTTFDIAGPEYQRRLEADIAEWSAKLRNSDDPSWADISVNEGRIDGVETLAEGRNLKAFAAKYGVRVDAGQLRAAKPKDMAKFVRDGREVQLVFTTTWKLQHKFLLKPAAAAAAKEYGRRYVDDDRPGEDAAARYARIDAEVKARIKQLEDLSYTSVVRPGTDYPFRGYDASKFAWAVAFATQIEAGTKALAALADKGGGLAQPASCRLDAKVAKAQ